MAAAVTTVTKLDDGFFAAKFHVRIQHTDTQITTPVTIIDASALNGADPEATLHELWVEAVEWNSSDVDGILNLLFNATADQQALACIGYRGSHHGFLIKPTAAEGLNGDIQITTSGHANPSTLEMIITVRKNVGFLQQPTVLAAYITNEISEGVPKTLFVTGETLNFSVPFSDQVHVTPVPELEVKILKESTPDVFHTFKARGTNSGNQAALLLEHEITDEDFGELETVSLGALLATGAAKITGGFGNRPARLTGFEATDIYEGESEDVDDVEINPNRIIAAAFTSDGASDDVWEEGDVVTLAVVFGQPQVVTLDEDNSDIKVVVSGDTGGVDFDYLSGSGGRVLLFRATIPASGVAQGETGEVDLTAGINLVEDDAILSTLTDAEPTGVSDQDWSDLITVANLAINPD
jgi:hypothetical protein